MKVLVRADSGTEIGTGHIMRCLTLAVELRRRNHEVVFLCQRLEGNISDKIIAEGFEVRFVELLSVNNDKLPHSHWLRNSQSNDAIQTIEVLGECFNGRAHCLIVDHYGIDHRWESIVGQHTDKLLVIDDLADRLHCCDFLIDQTFNRDKNDYDALIPNRCSIMTGTKFALLRSEFSVPNRMVLKARICSRKRSVSNVLIMMGGTDHLNLTRKVLDSILPDERITRITVVLGPTAPHVEQIKNYRELDDRVSIIRDTSEIVELMLAHDICFGAAGTSSWERCATGLPSILTSFAKNQSTILQNLKQFGAIDVFNIDDTGQQILAKLEQLRDEKVYDEMSSMCLKVCDGNGTKRVVDKITQ
ncbi:UDP-2,4-diacetamido-2,4,6-trideoxy-beta-L-altropyranose hydrolase [Vibrio aquaticus]|uniref:UDP-2,4-diacetamido-2,4, 6-trideoxy-beta-L-altropyranose hydrolase n=1 Tax=Vibrio aquaticus TaxID=2496559 RepID=A0A3S0P502_9VIBR|nr:UDP-2,4-diacetamido-2,4,6-trideoxy-beta-L-altropyranose hydrolase [Vibrio aquaticus]RTZ14655.1 UDP-2,4-diacetamido-2,4,6-trideoxy-beta-L-altropyranose hydrolase [Vibrio aquaticus]